MLGRGVILCGHRRYFIPRGSGVKLLRQRLASSAAQSRELKSESDVDEFLSKPTWSVKSLLHKEGQVEDTPDITPERLRHLLRLSALPPPSTPEEEETMIRDLRAQLHFVKEIQNVDTNGVEPLQMIRDETAEGQKALEITLDTLKDALQQEEVLGRHHRRIIRKEKAINEKPEAENWDVLQQAPRKVGRYIVVEGADTR